LSHNQSGNGRFGDHIPSNVQTALNGLAVRSYTAADYGHLDAWMESLAQFYDGHSSDNKLLDQLVNAEGSDSKGFFTLKKALLVSVDQHQAPTGALCLNYKRGGAVKIGPVVVDACRRGQGIGKTLFAAADTFAIAVGARKLFATTSHLNTTVNHLFETYGYRQEAVFPNQYKQGSNELVWGKFTGVYPRVFDGKVESVVADEDAPVVGVSSYTEADRGYITSVNNTYGGWHDDLGEDFIDGMVAGHKRELFFQDKGKIILLGRTAREIPVGMLTYTPKRGGPVKVYPLAGTPSAQFGLIEKAKEMAEDNGNHKLYTFAHQADTAQHDLLTVAGFIGRGTLQSPYKDGHDLVAFDMMVK